MLIRIDQVKAMVKYHHRQDQSCTSSNKATHVSQDHLQHSGDYPHTTGSSSNKEAPATKDKSASTKLADIDINK